LSLFMGHSSSNWAFVTRQSSLNLIAEYMVLAALVAVFAWRGFIPAWKTPTGDFQDYYLAARLYRLGYPLEQVYDWTWIQRQKNHQRAEGSIVAFALLTPFSLLPGLPFSFLPPLLAKRGWLLLNLVLLGLAAYLLRRMSSLSARRVAILVFLAIVPLRANFINGQEYVLLLFLFTASAWLYFKNRPLAAGLTLAVGGALKIYPCLFLFFFVRKKQWRAVAGLVAGSIALWLLSVSLFGFETIRTYVEEVLPWPLRGEGQDPYSIQWNSFSGVLHRLFVAEPELNPHPVAHLPVLYAVLQPVCQALIFVPFLWAMGSSRTGVEREKHLWGAYVAMLLILSTNPASYDFNGLILTAVLTVGYLMETGRVREAASVVTLYGLVCFPLSRWVRSSPSGLRTLLAVPRLWAMTGLWICLLLVSLRPTSVPIRVWLKSREAVIFACIWLALVVPAVTLNLLNQRGEFAAYATRLFIAPDSYLQTDPVVTGEKVLFTMMTDRGYLTGVFDGTSLTRLWFGADSFHPAAGPTSPAGWVELASEGSQIVRFSVDANELTVDQFATQAQDAEKPAVSMDGRWLAFIRESKGRGTLWVRELPQGPRGAAGDLRERQVSGSELDVLDAAFDPWDEITFSARPRGRQPALFRTKPESASVAEESAPAPRRFPAVSPDGRWLAFSQRERSHWDLWVQDRQTRAERRLTHSECNSIAPAWYPDSKRLVYATDCARGYGLTALCRIAAVP
jgi:Glycosyltransferase family 87/WD40-like Beta Propeller Repeat